MSARKPQLPLLIDAFPAPPSHIPPTPSPSMSFNPPPSRPPSAPLPPVPGPSRITEADTLQILLLSSRSSRSRPSSKYSVASSANRDSIASTSSTHSYHGLGHSPRPSPRFPPPSSRSSSGSIPTSPRSPNRPSIAFSIDEEHEMGPPMGLRDVVSPMLPLFDDDDDDDGPVETSPRRRRRRNQANESISSINMRDILGATSGGEEDEAPASKFNASPRREEASGPPLASSHSHKSSLAYLKYDDFPPPPSMSVEQSTSDLSLADLASSSTATLRFPSIPSSPPPPPRTDVLPAKPRTPASMRTAVRSPSPDIDTIIQSTPKPARLTVARSFSASTGPRSKASVMRSVKSMRSIRGPADEFGAIPNPLRLSKTTAGRKKSTPFEGDDSLDYIVDGVWNHGDDEEEEKRVRRLEKELDGSGTDSDDSSLDLHTPLPHLMVRHGLLSPNSKLLPDTDPRSNTPFGGVDGRPGSTMSQFSTVSKSGVMKDERDTPNRRVRHRDGRLLRGGIGLTTGLGWSDSEDEDAPSPLTKRLSTLNLSTRSSTSSSARPHPLSRSYSSGTLHDNFSHEDDDEPVDEWGAIRQQRTVSASNPPTSWSRKMNATTTSARTSIASSGGRMSIASSNGRYSMASNGSLFSHDGIPEGYEPSMPSYRRTPRTSQSSGDSGLNHDMGTHSSGSTLSIPLPVTPQHDQSPPNILTSLSAKKKPTLGKNKDLPPLPGGLKKVQSKANLAASTNVPPSKQSFPRARTFSNTSSTASTPSSLFIPGAPSTPTAVRTLQLPRQLRTPTAGDRAPVPVPSISSRNLRKASLPTNSLTTSPQVPSRSLSTSDKPRPRTGTGMVYKTSSGSSKLRPPMPLQSASLSTSSIGRPRALVRPTAASHMI
ncbi:hypothetical protein D9611_009367 [Ephemerocybe angulata]|uniref:Uncharacterized protein n=1 Tax=Ephemerocybe angulata TaxID=980116 RepID=A0A8H5F4I0_9AGAR|nr:hypothetical protein D9611_009367 [Tulosesus angulatus]